MLLVAPLYDSLHNRFCIPKYPYLKALRILFYWFIHISTIGNLKNRSLRWVLNNSQFFKYVEVNHGSNMVAT